MERRRALAVAASAAMTALAAGAAIAANFGLLGFGQADSSRIGQLGAVRAATSETVLPATAATGPAPSGTVRYEDIYLPAPAAAPTATPAPATTAAAAPQTAAVADGSTDPGSEHEQSHAEGGSDEHEEDD
jgi:hypothetical protein